MKTVLLVEGKDEELLLGLLLEPLGVHGIQIENVKGKDNFGNVIRALPDRPDFATKEVGILAVIRDADQNSDSAHQSLADHLANAGFPRPAEARKIEEGNPRNATFIIAKSDGTGMLEDLCLSSMEGAAGYDCLQPFFDCAASQDLRPSNLNKARVRAWLSLQHEWDLSVGEAARKGLWKLDHPAFSDLKEFLGKIAQITEKEE